GAAAVGDGHWRVVGAVDRDGQGGAVGEGAVADRVGERVGGGVPNIQGLHRRVILIDDIGVGAVAVQGQGAVGADRASTHRAAGDSADAQLGVAVVDVGVVGQHVAGGIGASRAIERAARFRGAAGVGDGHWRVVGAVDRDGECGAVGQAAVADRVGERVGGGVTNIQGLHR